MNHHPEPSWLEQYAAGTLAVPRALCVGVHLTFCSACRQQVEVLQGLGGALLTQLEPAPLDEALFLRVLGAIEPAAAPANDADAANREAAVASVAVVPPAALADDIPKPLRRLIPHGYDGLRWRRMLPGLRMAKLDIGDGNYLATLQRVRAGGRVATHDHRGEELTLVLRGTFSDEFGVYRGGDFLRREPDQVHTPTAARNEECICLSVFEAPPRFTKLFWRLLNPFLG